MNDKNKDETEELDVESDPTLMDFEEDEALGDQFNDEPLAEILEEPEENSEDMGDDSDEEE